MTRPTFIYGTAWKEERTGPLVHDALEAGFVAFDTANQRKHYVEAALGNALASAIAAGRTTRDELWIQTKFTFQGGQDHRLPYDPAAPVEEQVAQSMASSLNHLHTDYVDSYVLHGPTQRTGLGDDDLRAWRAMEAAYEAGQTRALGVSNVSASQLSALLDHAKHPPSWAQIRTFARNGWEADLRRVCEAHGVGYQGFSVLTANRPVWGGPTVAAIAEAHDATPAQVLYAFAQQRGMVPLMGSSNPRHMAEALASRQLELSADEVERIEAERG